MATRFSWKRGPSYDGLRMLSRSYELNYGGKRLAVAQEDRNGKWFWYCDKVNTAHRPDTLDNVKAEAVAFFRSR